MAAHHCVYIGCQLPYNASGAFDLPCWRIYSSCLCCLPNLPKESCLFELPEQRKATTFVSGDSISSEFNCSLDCLEACCDQLLTSIASRFAEAIAPMHSAIMIVLLRSLQTQKT